MNNSRNKTALSNKNHSSSTRLKIPSLPSYFKNLKLQYSSKTITHQNYTNCYDSNFNVPPIITNPKVVYSARTITPINLSFTPKEEKYSKNGFNQRKIIKPKFCYSPRNEKSLRNKSNFLDNCKIESTTSSIDYNRNSKNLFFQRYKNFTSDIILPNKIFHESIFGLKSKPTTFKRSLAFFRYSKNQNVKKIFKNFESQSNNYKSKFEQFSNQDKMVEMIPLKLFIPYKRNLTCFNHKRLIIPQILQYRLINDNYNDSTRKSSKFQYQLKHESKRINKKIQIYINLKSMNNIYSNL